MARVGLDKEKIVKEAASMANEVGTKNLNMKDLAKRFGVKSPSLYKHIEGIDTLNKEIMLYGWRMLENEIVSRVLGMNTDDAVRAMCNAYYDFALDNPGIFETMQWYNRYDSAENKNATEGIYHITSKIFLGYKLSKEQKMHLVRTFRSFLQGYMMITINNGFGSKESIKESFDLSVDILIKGIKGMEEQG